MNDKQFYRDVLKSDECQCGVTKKPGYPFCYNCYSDLPNDLREQFFEKSVDFDIAYEAAEEWLRAFYG